MSTQTTSVIADDGRIFVDGEAVGTYEVILRGVVKTSATIRGATMPTSYDTSVTAACYSVAEFARSLSEWEHARDDERWLL